MNPLCLYHNDADGACSAWAVRQVLPDAGCVPVRYGEPPPLELAKGRHVYVVDFSYPTDELLALARSAHILVVIDHHKTGEARLRDVSGLANTACYFDHDRSGCGLTWDVHFPLKPRPWWVDYVEDRDLWRFDLPDSKAVNAYLSSLPFGPEAFDDLSPLHKAARNRAPRDVVDMGNAILRYQRQQVETLCRQAYSGKLPAGMYTVPIVNTSALISEVTHELSKGEPFAASWYLRRDGRVRWSLRSDEDGVDVSKIALGYGGGGHKHAAGFHTTIDELWESLA